MKDFRISGKKTESEKGNEKRKNDQSVNGAEERGSTKEEKRKLPGKALTCPGTAEWQSMRQRYVSISAERKQEEETRREGTEREAEKIRLKSVQQVESL